MKKTMLRTRFTQAAALCTALLALASCEEKTLYTHAELYGGTLALTASWQGNPTAQALQVEAVSQTSGVEHSETLVLSATGTLTATLPEARYLLTATHEAAGLTFDGTAFCLTPGADGLLPAPADLSVAQAEVKVAAQQTTSLSLPMRRLTRTLSLRFSLGAASAAEVTGMEVRISGMASSVSLTGDDRTATEPGTISVPMSLSGADGVVYTGTVLTLGTVPGRQQYMSVTVHLADGTRFTTGRNVQRELAALNVTRQGTFRADFGLYAAGKPGSDLHFGIGPWEDGGGDDDGDAGMVVPDGQ